jgi:hypothetical protein
MYQGLQREIAAVLPQAFASGMFTSTVTLMAPTGALGPSGAPLIPPNGFAEVDGYVNLPCVAAPLSTNRIQSTEMRDLEEITASSPQHILLDGYFPNLEAGAANGWLANLDGGTSFWIVLGAESDSQSQMTRMAVKLASI